MVWCLTEAIKPAIDKDVSVIVMEILGRKISGEYLRIENTKLMKKAAIARQLTPHVNQ